MAPTTCTGSPYSVTITATPLIGSAASQTFSISCGAGTPVMIQHNASATLPQGYTGDSAYLYTIPVGPNPVQWGDCLVLGITYLHGNTITISDFLGNSGRRQW